MPGRLALFAAALCALLVGVLGGLARFGHVLPAATQAGNHGALMICGLFGTLIGLERAVAMGRLWVYMAPLLSASGVLALLFGIEVVPLFFVNASAVLCIACLELWTRQRVLHLATLSMGAALWLVGNLIWLQQGSVAAAVPAWLGFLVLTIAAERLELSSFLPASEAARRVFALLMALLLAGLLPDLDAVFALGLLGLACWLLRYDIVRHTVKQRGLPRYIAVCLITGYVWLGIGGALMLTQHRDAALHAVLLGFVFSMVFGHAPIILPAVARARLPYHGVLYLPLMLLHASLALRVGASLSGDFVVRSHAAIGNGLALALFAATASVLILGRRKTTDV